MSICIFCQKIFLGGSGDDRTLRPLAELATGHHFDCSLCNYFKAHLGYTTALPTTKLVFRDYHYHETDIVLPLWYGPPRLPILELQVYEKDRGASLLPVIYRAFTVEDDPLSGLFAGRLVQRDGAAEASLNRMAELASRHVKSSVDGALPYLPTRVLNIGESGASVRVLLRNGRRGQWVALSHCWGQDRSKHFNTTVDNLKDRMLSMAITDMPRTFQDAVTVTRKLGLSYLWIDSLCIIQGQGGDWATEAPKMGSYYGDAFITISADSGDDDSDGLLRMRSATPGTTRYGDVFSEKRHHDAADTIYSDELDEFVYQHGEESRHLFLKRVSWSGHVSQRNPVKDLPLQRRAWTLQERCLSRHILHFGVEQNYLELLEDGKTIYEDGREVYHSLFWTKLYTEGQALPFKNWYGMVEDYTQRKVSFRSDTFPAISSLARNVSKISNDTYRAGLWEADLVHGLLWAVTNPGSPPRWTGLSPIPLTSDYIAPSWSWGSSSGAVHFLLNELRNTVDIESVLLGYGPQHAIDDDDASLFTLINCDTPALYAEFPDGQLAARGILKINAPMFPVPKWKRTKNRSDSRGRLPDKWYVTLNVANHKYEVEVLMDSLIEESTSIEHMVVHAVCLARKFGAEDDQKVVSKTILRGPKCLYGLVLAEEWADSEVMYRRIGAFEDRLFSRDDHSVFVLWDAVAEERNRRPITIV